MSENTETQYDKEFDLDQYVQSIVEWHKKDLKRTNHKKNGI